MSTDRVYLAMCAIYRDESPYLAEWIEFHRQVGVERFYLYDNCSTDDHRRVLSGYVDSGLVEIRHWHVDPQPQLPAYDDCLRSHRADARWIAFLDIDEFLFSPTGEPLPEILRDYEGAPGIGVNLFIYGTSGHQQPPPGLVIENYTRRGGPVQTHIKSIVNPPLAVHSIGAHHFRYLAPEANASNLFREIYAVDEDHVPLPWGLTPAHSAKRLRINHYYTRSEKELEEKFARRRADTDELRESRYLKAIRETDSFNKIDDPILARYGPAVRAALEASESASRSIEPVH